MKNPWLKKNPFMSLWLSAAHKVGGSVRAQATASAKRELGRSLAQVTASGIKPLRGTSAAARPKAKAKARTPKR